MAPVFEWKNVNHSSGRKPSLTGALLMGRVRRGKLTRSLSEFSLATEGELDKGRAVDSTRSENDGLLAERDHKR